MLSPSKDHQTVIEQQPAPSPNVTKDSDILVIPGDADMVQQMIPINKSGPQDSFSLWRKEDEFQYSHDKSCVIYSSQEAFYLGGEEPPSISVVGNIVWKKERGKMEYIHKQQRVS